ncbi:polyprenyl synthetase [Hanstruepera neustonica]|uniref:Polyprenyl synthetase n=1 Tax=Hanstruepera neustonica TaxID=1445657 RepID=A0A2K1DVG8_9FLAO|nr:polyprenyl synthetase family protein [Hanstruepera neustonica]PNQ72035.1 polyprenyl synthetase [Hanstruepera neustonica]
MQSISFYQKAFSSYLEDYQTFGEPSSLYAPINYILKLGGKRLRPVLTLMSAELFDADYKLAMNAALSIEVFHNFSLIHDDIMDAAPLRRGQETVHEKWDVNTGILSGDAMLIMAYKLFENYPCETFQALAKLFSKTALEVCEGQQYDIDFETQDHVTIGSYLKMIEYKTAVLVGAAMKMGAIVANAKKEDQDRIYEFGKNLGIAFQLQDDYLDAFGDPKTFGKQVGGDIIENKKTILYIKSFELGDDEDRQQLSDLYSLNPTDQTDKIKTIKSIFETTGAADATKNEISKFTNKAFEVLNQLNIPNTKKTILKEFGLQLMNRSV